MEHITEPADESSDEEEQDAALGLLPKRKHQAIACQECSSEDEDDDETSTTVSMVVATPKMIVKPKTCGYTQKQLQAMSLAQRTKYDSSIHEVVGLCRNCTKDWRPIKTSFLPKQGTDFTVRKTSQLKQACLDYEWAFGEDCEDDMDDAMDRILDRRNGYCQDCANNMKPSPSQQACADEYILMKKVACKANGDKIRADKLAKGEDLGDDPSYWDGCIYPDCSERGMAAWMALSGNHLDPNPAENLALSRASKWAQKKHGGVEGMRREQAKGMEWPCFCCHMTEATSSTGQQRKEKTKQGQKNQDALVLKKQEYVNAHFKRGKMCAYPGCNRKCVAGLERTFDFSHLNPADKPTFETYPHLLYNSKRAKQGIAGLVNNPLERASLAHIKDILDYECTKPTVVIECGNCHHCRRPKMRGRWDASV